MTTRSKSYENETGWLGAKQMRIETRILKIWTHIEVCDFREAYGDPYIALLMEAIEAWIGPAANWKENPPTVIDGVQCGGPTAVGYDSSDSFTITLELLIEQPHGYKLSASEETAVQTWLDGVRDKLRADAQALGQRRNAQRGIRKGPGLHEARSLLEDCLLGPDIPCEGFTTETSDGQEYECGYGAEFNCEDCMVNGGEQDPRELDNE